MQPLECIRKTNVLLHTEAAFSTVYRLTHTHTQGICVKWRSAIVFLWHSAILAEHSYKKFQHLNIFLLGFIWYSYALYAYILLTSSDTFVI